MFHGKYKLSIEYVGAIFYDGIFQGCDLERFRRANHLREARVKSDLPMNALVLV